MERLKTTFAYKSLNENYAQKLKFSKQKMDLMNKVAVKEERVRNIKYRDLEKKKKRWTSVHLFFILTTILLSLFLPM